MVNHPPQQNPRSYTGFRILLASGGDRNFKRYLSAGLVRAQPLTIKRACKRRMLGITQSLFGTARQVLDYYYCSEYLQYRMVKAQYGDSQQALNREMRYERPRTLVPCLTFIIINLIRYYLSE